jgi:hypothetical protein
MLSVLRTTCLSFWRTHQLLARKGPESDQVGINFFFSTGRIFMRPVGVTDVALTASAGGLDQQCWLVTALPSYLPILPKHAHKELSYRP